VTEPLMTALRTNRVNHAYLFSGPRGCGKTTSARILARCLNCAQGPTDTPCGKCASCIELGRNGAGSLDVVEIDAASHGGVDDARDLRERAIFAPARDRYKIFILDEAHMVTASGFNALLKIVEEPPEHVKFIFATTEPDKVIGTIRSRTHHYPFRLVPPAQMLDYAQQMCDSEKITVAPGVLPLVVRAGGGSPRDTLSLLDQLMAGSEGNSIEYERAVALLGYTHAALLDEAVDAIAARDAAAAFTATDRVIQTGQDPRRFVEDLLERLRDLIIVAATSAEGAAAVLRGIPQDELDRMDVQASKFGQAELSRCADIVNAALTEMTGATSPRLHLELMIARMLVPSADNSERGALARVERLERRVGVTDAGASVQPTPDAGAERAVRVAQPAPPRLDAVVPAGLDTVAERPTRPAESAAAARPVGPVTTQQVKDSWPQILDAVQKAKRSAWLVVYTAHVRGLNDDILTLSFPSGNDVASFKQQTGGSQGVSEYLRQAILAVLGIRVKFIARADGERPGADAPPQQRAPAPVTATPAPVTATPAPGTAAPAPGTVAPAPTNPAPAANANAPAASGRTRLAPAVSSSQPRGQQTPSAPGWPTVTIPGSGLGAPARSHDEAPSDDDAPPEDDAPPDTHPPFDASVPTVHDQASPPPSAAPDQASDGWYEGPTEPDEQVAPGSERGADLPDGRPPVPDSRPSVPDGRPPASSAAKASSGQAARPGTGAPSGHAAASETRAASSVSFAKPQRYGEAVVREILGARFIEEQPAPSGEAR
jgi:DNA polymerase III subunit gamma/tau